MEKIIEKIGIYHFINYLLPGTVFITILSNILDTKIMVDENIFVATIEFYFAGLLASRISSVIIKPLLEKIKVVKFVQYEEYIEAIKKDSKIELLQQEGNQFRVYISVFLILFFVEVYRCILLKIFIWELVLFLAIACLFSISYKKQVELIAKRVKHSNI